MELADHIPKLVELVSLRFVSLWLDVQQSGNARMIIDEVATSGSIKRKAEPDEQGLELPEGDSPAALKHAQEYWIRRSLRHVKSPSQGISWSPET
jgi:hypothetical protein